MHSITGKARLKGILTMTVLGLFLAACVPPATSQDFIPSLEVPTPTVVIPLTGPGPVCSQPASLTPSLTEGPYFKAGSPERTSLIEANTKGTRLFLSGYVLTTNCTPVAHALLDFWQSNAAGQYDNSGYALRGHQYTDSKGYYQLTTIIPGLYPGRTEHIHVKVQAPGGPVLTTQLFFPGVAQNETDGIFNLALVLSLQTGPSGDTASFNFIIPTK
jgi:hypothetical protein